MATGLAALESLLRDRKLDVTLTSARPGEDPEDRVAPTGTAGVDDVLGGGLRRGHLSEIVGPASSGRATVLVGALAAATARGEVVALIDTHDRFDPAGAAAMGVDLSHLLWVRERGDAARALKAVNLVVQAGGFGVVAFDLSDVPPRDVRQFPHTTWLRLSRVIDGSQTVLLLVGSERIARSSGGASLALEGAGGTRALWTGQGPRARHLTGLEITPRLRASRFGEAGAALALSTSHVARRTSHVARRT
jgi:recombination protein RecA